jgi:NhaA family Na+:H+ antiporter
MSRPTHHFAKALDHDFSAAITLSIGVLVALVWSATDTRSYQHLVIAPWSIGLLSRTQLGSMHDVVVTGLMTVFFYAIGLELSRELENGTLIRPAHSMPPILGAIGGMAVTALTSLAVGEFSHTAALRHGWGVPMATDIAFALGAFAIAGRGLPPTLRIFLLTLAVADDVFSVTILSVTGATHVRALGVCAIVIVTVGAKWISRWIRSIPWRLTVLVALWCCFVAAHVEPPLAGVVAALIVPFDRSAGLRLEDNVRRWSTALVLPLFALVSCGVHWSALSGRSVTTIVVATFAIRMIGKVVGIGGGVGIARLFGYPLHPSITIGLLATSSLLCAVGFTVPLMFASALYPTSGPAYGAFTLGLLISSAFAAVVGVVLLKKQAKLR